MIFNFRKLKHIAQLAYMQPRALRYWALLAMEESSAWFGQSTVSSKNCLNVHGSNVVWIRCSVE